MMLARLQMDVCSCVKAYTDLADKVFTL